MFSFIVVIVMALLMDRYRKEYTIWDWVLQAYILVPISWILMCSIYLLQKKVRIGSDDF
jgi:hypothetical protein